MNAQSMENSGLHLVQFDLTDECPLYCLHCSNSSGPQMRTAIPSDIVRQALFDADLMGCRSVVFSGGEPLTHPDLPRFLKHSASLAMRSTIFTTGTRNKFSRLPLTPQDWAELKSVGLDTAVFSVYSSPENRGFHNHVVRMRPVGAADAFEANQTGILSAREAGISVEVQFIPSDETCPDLLKIAEWATRNGIVQLHLQYPTDQGRNARHAHLRVSANQATLKLQALSLLGDSRIAFHISRLWRSRWGMASDSARPGQVIVRSDGAVSQCNACKHASGNIPEKNIYNERLIDIWKDDNWRNASCQCPKLQISQVATIEGRERVYKVRADGVFAPSLK